MKTDSENFQISQKPVCLSVTEFVTPLERSGSLFAGKSSGGSQVELWQGQQAHIKVQKRLQQVYASYQKEVAISGTLTFSSPHPLEVGGRIDGLYTDDFGTVTIDEIKSTRSPRALAEVLKRDDTHPYIRQLQMYGYLHQLKTNRQVELSMRVVDIFDPEKEIVINVPFQFEVFELWVEARVRAWTERLTLARIRNEERRKTAAQLEFPYENPRPGQLELINFVQNTAEKNKRAVIQAPTGLGKTMGVLFPLLKNALSEDRKVFYITPKNSQHELVHEAVKRLNSNETLVSCVSLLGKEKACLKEEIVCHPDYCEYALNYYDKINENNLLQEAVKIGNLDSETIRNIGLEKVVCPFELALDLTDNADIVVCDYNYVFSPHSALQRFFEEDRRTHLINLAIDEAHNLYSRAMDYYSPALSVMHLKKLAQQFEEEIIRSHKNLLHRAIDICDEISAQIIRDVRGHPEHSTIEFDKKPYFNSRNRIQRLVSKFIEDNPLTPLKHPLMELERYSTQFCEVLELSGSHMVYTQSKKFDTRLQITCCDASEFLEERISKFHTAVAFSATIKPFDFYSKLSGFREADCETQEFTSPFAKENRKILIIPQVSTQYKDRSQTQFQKIGEAISRIISAHRGNYMVFFPSYEFLTSTAAHINLPGFRMLSQTPKMKPSEVSAVLKKLRQKTKNVVILGVQGGTFSEGIDCPGDQLIGALVVGPGLPAFSLERECIRDYYEKKYGAGFDYAYAYPAMTKVIQAAGRVIRTETDRGLIVLLDRRFIHPVYEKSMPLDWTGGSAQSLVSQSILSDLKAFWDKP